MPDYAAYNQTAKVLALSRYSRVGPRLFDLLLNRFGDLEAVFAASTESLREITEIPAAAAARITSAEKHLPKAAAELDQLARRDIAVVTRFDEAYPVHLEEINDPPPLLYVRGKLPANDRKTVTLAGATHATNAGIELTVKLARRFSESDVQVVSSLRLGIDAAAHLGARAAHAPSFAVTDAGFDHLDPTAQLPLAIDALHTGGVISEYAPDQPAAPTAFHEANRLLVGMSHAVVLSEVYTASPEVMDLVEYCGEIGKMVFLVTHPELGPLSEEQALTRLTEHGVIPLDAGEVDKIIAVLV